MLQFICNSFLKLPVRYYILLVFSLLALTIFTKPLLMFQGNLLHLNVKEPLHSTRLALNVETNDILIFNSCQAHNFKLSNFQLSQFFAFKVIS